MGMLLFDSNSPRGMNDIGASTRSLASTTCSVNRDGFNAEIVLLSEISLVLSGSQNAFIDVYIRTAIPSAPKIILIIVLG